MKYSSIEEINFLKRNIQELDVYCRKIDDLSILNEFTNLKELQIRSFRAPEFPFSKSLVDLETLILENVSMDNSLTSLKPLKNLRQLTLQTPVGWDGTGKKLIYSSLDPLNHLERLEEITLLEIIIEENGFTPLFNLKNLKRVNTHNTFTTKEFAELSLKRPDISCEYSKAYRVKEKEYNRCVKCGNFKVEFSGIGIKRRVYCPICHKKKFQELTSRFEEIKKEINGM